MKKSIHTIITICALSLAFTLQACAANTKAPESLDNCQSSECHELSASFNNEPECYNESEACLDEWYEYGDKTGDYGPIDGAF